jgi:hypothetical protein
MGKGGRRKMLTAKPEELLKKWQAHDQRMFDTRDGGGI